MEFTKEQIGKVYGEIDRRIAQMVRTGILETAEEVREEKNSMYQGMYSTLIMVSNNWPEIRSWCDWFEAERP